MTITDSELPAQLIDAWHHLVDLERRLEASIQEDGDLQEIEALASERHKCLLSFFEDLPTNAETAPLRQRLLEHSLTVNQKLTSAGQKKLVDAAGSISQARHKKRAVAAYHSQN